MRKNTKINLNQHRIKKQTFNKLTTRIKKKPFKFNQSRPSEIP